MLRRGGQRRKADFLMFGLCEACHAFHERVDPGDY